MAYTPLFGSRQREQVWQLECLAAYQAGRGNYPICVHCDRPVTPSDAWDRAHVTVPRALGGKSVGVGHRRCNQQDNNQVVTPMVAKAERVRKKHVGIAGPGLGRSPMRCGRRSSQRRTMRGQIVKRQTYAEQHRQFLRDRYGIGCAEPVFAEVDDFSAPLEVSLSAPLEVSPDGASEVQP